MERIGVFRALALGDLLCATPALRALRKAYPRARITLIGLPWAEGLVERLPSLDDFIAFPGFPGMPEREPDIAAFPAFLETMRARSFDLLLQLHGSGLLTNPIVAACKARRIAGFYREGEDCPDVTRFVPWPERGHEIERLLAVVERLGIPRDGTSLDLPITSADRAEVRALAPRLADERYVCVHPGARLPSRRWPAEQFGAVVDALAARGYTIVLTGSDGEREIVDAVKRAIHGETRGAVIDLVGRTSLWTLAALVDGAAVVVCNDTGLSHVAAARGTPSVIVSAGSDPERWAPLDAARHRFLAQMTPCRPCLYDVCPTAHECATAIDVDTVVNAALTALEESESHAA